VTWNTFTGNAIVAQNTSTGNLAVTQNTISGNLVVSNRTQTNNLAVVSLANIANANLINATITTLTVIDPIQAPATTADDKYILRFGATTDGNGTFRVQRSAVSGNAELFWNDITDSWNFLANGLPATLNTGNLSAANLTVTGNISAANLTVTGAINTTGNITGTMKSVKDFLDTSTVSGTVSANLANSNWFRYTLSGNTTFNFINAPASGTSMTFSLIVIQGSGGGKTVSWGNTVYWAGGQVPPATTSAAGRTDLWTFTTFDGGATYIGTLAVKDAR
jgi:hypothetical protein